MARRLVAGRRVATDYTRAPPSSGTQSLTPSRSSARRCGSVGRVIISNAASPWVFGSRRFFVIHRELQELNPSAARSLAEGLDETLTVNRLPLEGWLRRMLATTNPIESTFSVVETVCRRVKCWQRGDHLERWVGSALWVAEGNFRRIKGYRDLPKLLAALEKLRPQPPESQAKAA